MITNAPSEIRLLSIAVNFRSVWAASGPTVVRWTAWTSCWTCSCPSWAPTSLKSRPKPVWGSVRRPGMTRCRGAPRRLVNRRTAATATTDRKRRPALRSWSRSTRRRLVVYRTKVPWPANRFLRLFPVRRPSVAGR